MTEEHPPELDQSVPTRLRPLVARLLEIQRKCGTLGPRNEEARDMAARLQAIIAELSRGDADGHPPPRYRELARQLFPVARLFESLGFMSVAREVGHVERLLTEMDPASAPLPTAPTAPTTARPVDSRAPATEPAPAEVPAASRRSPRAVYSGLLVLLLAAVAAVVVIVRQQPGRTYRLPGSPEATATRGGNALPTPAGSALPTPARARPASNSSGRSRLADLIGEARLAQQAGDLERAIELLNHAAAIDIDAGAVHETAQELVEALIVRSDQAAGEARWEDAAALLERARDLALRFDLPVRPIDEAVRRQGGLERYRRLSPRDITALRAAIGSRVIVITDGAPREGRLTAVDGGLLQLQLGLDVGGDGTLLHTSEVPLTAVREVRVYPD